jgi:transposase-like protein
VDTRTTPSARDRQDLGTERHQQADGQGANRPVYAATGAIVDGHKDVLALWMGVGGEGAKFWMSVAGSDLKNRGVRDMFFLVCDVLTGLPEFVAKVWPQTIVRTCVVQLIRNTFRLPYRRDWDVVNQDIKPIYTAPNPQAALAALDELEKNGQQTRCDDPPGAQRACRAIATRVAGQARELPHQPQPLC